jgi:hypothetical protein
MILSGACGARRPPPVVARRVGVGRGSHMEVTSHNIGYVHSEPSSQEEGAHTWGLHPPRVLVAGVEAGVLCLKRNTPLPVKFLDCQTS